MSGASRVLGVDTSLRSTGVAVVQAEGHRLVAVEYGAIRNGPALPLSACLVRLQDGVAALIERTLVQPSEATRTSDDGSNSG